MGKTLIVAGDSVKIAPKFLQPMYDCKV